MSFVNVHEMTPMDPLAKVNLLQGTDSNFGFSRGNTLPLITRPWGRHHWSPQTAAGTWLFHPADRQLWGLRLTHQPSPWMGDYGSLLVTAFHHEFHEALPRQASAWKVEECVLRPDLFRANLLRYGIRLEMAPTEHGAQFVFTRTQAEPLRIRFNFDAAHEITGHAGNREFSGISRNNQGGVAGDFGLRFFGSFNHAPTGFERAADGAYFTFGKQVDRVEMALTASFISEHVARAAFERELAGRTLDDAAHDAAAAWNALLKRIEIQAEDEAQERTFYSCLYRCLLYPRFADETGPDGQALHYSPYDGLVHPGPLCTDNGFWDTYRTVYPFLALVYPEVLTRMMEGWLNACREAGWSPRWASPGSHDIMTGTHYDAVVADAVARGITDWDLEGAFTYLWKNATTPCEHSAYGRLGLEDYIRLGYVPSDRVTYSVSRTLEYCYSDFCVRQVALHLGKHAEAGTLEPRLGFYRNVFDPAVGFMRGRLADGSWSEPFQEFAWGGPYIEGGPWQHTFNVPHDPEGLAGLFGGAKALCGRLDQMLATPPHYIASHYGQEIHEMTEMALAGFGQYAHSNQPVHAYLFLYALLGQPEKTGHWVRRVTRELYSPRAFPGDEDNGEMSAWYVLATLGLFPHCPGRGEYTQFRPLVREAAIHRPDLPAPIRRSSESAAPLNPVIGHRELFAL